MRALLLFPTALLVLLVAGVAGCDGPNFFQTPIVVPPGGSPPAVPPEEGDPVLRYLEEGTLLASEPGGLRFRWETPGPLYLAVQPGTPAPERAALSRAILLMNALGTPELRLVEGVGDIVVRTHAPSAYREIDPSRPWSFSRTFVTAADETGITGVEIHLSEQLGTATLERATLHALGHAMGIMGHPAFPGDRYVMAARAPDGAPEPVEFAPVERDAFRFLYSGHVAAGMTLEEFRQAYADAAR